MISRLLLCILALSTLLAGCADTHSLVRQTQGDVPKLTARDSFYIAVSKDGIYGDEKYEGSGLSLSQIILSPLAKRARKIEVGRSHQPYDDAVLFAKDKKFKYLIYPTILHWENHATEWNGIPDKVEVKIEIIETSTDKLIEAAIISGRSGLATFGGDQPQDLLPLPVEEFISNLFDNQQAVR